MDELKQIARNYNLSERIAFSKLRKAELVNALHEHLSVQKLIEKPPSKMKRQPTIKRQLSIPIPVDEDDREQRLEQLVRMIAQRRTEGKDVKKLLEEYRKIRES